MSRYTARILSAFEDDTTDVVTPPDTDLEDTVSELDVRERAVENGLQSVTRDADDLDTMSRIAGTLHDSLDEGGVGESAAKMAEIAVESIYRRLQIPRPTLLVPSMEHFASHHSRKAATRIALEGIIRSIVDFLVRLKDAVLTYFQEAWVVIKKVYRVVKMGGDQINLKAEIQIYDNLDDLYEDIPTVTTPTESTFEHAVLAKAFASANYPAGPVPVYNQMVLSNRLIEAVLALHVKASTMAFRLKELARSKTVVDDLFDSLTTFCQNGMTDGFITETEAAVINGVYIDGKELKWQASSDKLGVLTVKEQVNAVSKEITVADRTNVSNLTECYRQFRFKLMQVIMSDGAFVGFEKNIKIALDLLIKHAKTYAVGSDDATRTTDQITAIQAATSSIARFTSLMNTLMIHAVRIGMDTDARVALYLDACSERYVNNAENENAEEPYANPGISIPNTLGSNTL